MLGDNILAFQAALLSWYRTNGRNFPWREQRDPFAILIAEKLLQQTAARPTLVAVYNELLRLYPTPEALADADITHLRLLIRPLGLVYRSDELPEIAKALVAHYGSKVPDTLKDLLDLPGVGDYGARAVLSFAYGQDLPIVDTNVARWLYRVDGIPGPLPSNPARKKNLIQRAAELVPPGQARDWNYAILDLCAIVCKPLNPQCPQCPVLSFCTYGNRNTIEAGPPSFRG